ncbi:MAG: twin-arginine translocase subunit TatC [Actinomycetota bacterium]
MKNPLSRSKDKPVEPEGEMSLLAHLTELRTRLMWSVGAIVVGAIIVFIFNNTIFELLQEPYCDAQTAQGKECEFLVRSPTEGFSVVITLSGYGGLLLSLPFVLYQMGKFVLPGLYPSERRALMPFFFASVILLLIGLVGGYLLMPKALEVLASFGPDTFTELFSPTEYLGFFIKMMLAFGVAAEFPLVLVFLQMVGAIQTRTLRKNRRIAMVAVVILAAVITPTGDPFMLGVLSVPMYLSYEVAILIGARITKRRDVLVTG